MDGFISMKKIIRYVLVGVLAASMCLLSACGNSSALDSEIEEEDLSEKELADADDEDEGEKVANAYQDDYNLADMIVIDTSAYEKEEAVEEEEDDAMTELPEEYRDSQGYVDDSGNIVYATTYMSDEDLWWAIRTYSDIQHKWPIYVSTMNGSIKYDVTWDNSAGHWRVVKYVKNKEEYNELYDDKLEFPLNYDYSIDNLVKARSDNYSEWGFPGTDVYEHMIRFDVDDYGNSIRIYKDGRGVPYVAVDVVDMKHVPKEYVMTMDNVMSGLNKGDKIPVLEIRSYTGKDTNIVIPSHILRISEKAFFYNKELESVDLSGVYDIGERAFYGCMNLKKVKFGNKLYSIGKQAFTVEETPMQLGDITLPDCLTSVPFASFQFEGCSSITWNGKKYTDSKEFEDAFKESGGNVR